MFFGLLPFSRHTLRSPSRHLRINFRKIDFYSQKRYYGKNAEVAELVDAHDSKSCRETCESSILSFGTIKT